MHGVTETAAGGRGNTNGTKHNTTWGRNDHGERGFLKREVLNPLIFPRGCHQLLGNETANILEPAETWKPGGFDYRAQPKCRRTSVQNRAGWARTVKWLRRSVIMWASAKQIQTRMRKFSRNRVGRKYLKRHTRVRCTPERPRGSPKPPDTKKYKNGPQNHANTMKSH